MARRSPSPSPNTTVGVRELRQNLSRYLEKVKQGETLTVTERGQEVARLVPSAPEVDPYYRELAERFGATTPRGRLVEIIRSLPPLSGPAAPGTTDAILAEDRREHFPA